MQDKIFYRRWTIVDFKSNLDDIKNIRKNYIHYPYLYAYDDKAEAEYLAALMTAEDKLDAFVAVCEDKLIGISIGCPLIENIAICADLYTSDLNNGNSYYFSDIVLDNRFWGKGIAKNLYQQHLDHIKQQGYTQALALLVQNQKEDPRTPENFKSSTLWQDFNFNPTDIRITYAWYTVQANGAPKHENHELIVYKKTVATPG